VQASLARLCCNVKVSTVHPPTSIVLSAEHESVNVIVLIVVFHNTAAAATAAAAGIALPA
jgi:hypothetical protein